MNLKKIIKKLLLLVIIVVLLLGGYNILKKYNIKAGLEALKSKGFLITDYSNLKGSKLTGDNYSFDSTYNPYYGMLSNNGKKLYRQVYANMVHRKKVFIPRVKMHYKDVNNVIEAVNNDNPELFWVDNKYSYKYTPDKVCRQVILDYNGLAKNYSYNKRVFDNRVNRIISSANRLSSSYEKELYVHDQLRNSIVYDKNSSYNQTSYSALVNGRTVCAGYAKAFQYIMSRLGIPTYYVTGVSQNEEHAWNIIKLDGYYNVDVTWDDASGSSYAYFNKTDGNFNRTHYRKGLSRYLSKCNATRYSYSNMNKPAKKKSTNKTVPKETPKVTPPEENKPDIEDDTNPTEDEQIETEQ